MEIYNVKKEVKIYIIYQNWDNDNVHEGLHICILSCNLVVLLLMNMCHYCHHQCYQLFHYQLILL